MEDVKEMDDRDARDVVDEPVRPREGPRQGWGPQPNMPPHPHYHPPPPPPPWPGMRHRMRSNKPRVVGALLAIVGVLGLIMMAMSAGAYVMFDDMDEWFQGDEDDTVTLQGRIIHLNGTGVEDVQVSVVGQAMSTLTDEEGYYLIYNVPTGDSQVRAEKAGYVTVIRKVTLTPDMGFEMRMSGEVYPGDSVDITLTEGTGEVTVGRYASEHGPWEFAGGWLGCTAIMAVASVLALFGSYSAYKRRSVSFVLVGAVAGLFTIGFVVGSVLSFVALFMVLLGMDEFRTEEEEETA